MIFSYRTKSKANGCLPVDQSPNPTKIYQYFFFLNKPTQKKNGSQSKHDFLNTFWHRALFMLIVAVKINIAINSFNHPYRDLKYLTGNAIEEYASVYHT